MLKSRKIRSPCGIIAFMGDNNAMCNLTLPRAPDSCTIFAGKNRNFHLLLIAYRSRTNSHQNHRDFACPACITKRRTSLSPITRCPPLLLIYHVLFLLQHRMFPTCDTLYKIYDRPISYRRYRLQTSVLIA